MGTFQPRRWSDCGFSMALDALFFFFTIAIRVESMQLWDLRSTLMTVGLEGFSIIPNCGKAWVA